MKNWNGMFKKLGSKSGVASTYPTTDDVVRAEPVSDELVAEMVDRERFENIKAENVRLTAQIQKDWRQEYDRGYEDALKAVFNRIEERDGRAGKKQILGVVQGMLSEVRGES